MFLKHYAKCSDNQLIAQLSVNFYYQFFFDIHISPTHRLHNYKIVSEIRCELASKLNIEKLQEDLADNCRQYMVNRESIIIDATCYESYLGYLTDVKLLWESVSWYYKMLKKINNKE